MYLLHADVYRQSPVGGSGAVFPSTVDSLPASPMTEAVDNSIGVLKRKSIMPISSAAGASRRKRHRPAAVEQESVIGGNSEANEQGVSLYMCDSAILWLLLLGYCYGMQYGT